MRPDGGSSFHWNQSAPTMNGTLASRLVMSSIAVGTGLLVRNLGGKAEGVAVAASPVEGVEAVLRDHDRLSAGLLVEPDEELAVEPCIADVVVDADCVGETGLCRRTTAAGP